MTEQEQIAKILDNHNKTFKAIGESMDAFRIHIQLLSQRVEALERKKKGLFG